MLSEKKFLPSYCVFIPEDLSKEAYIHWYDHQGKAGEPLSKGFWDAAENGGVFYIFVGDAVDGGGPCGDGDAGVDEYVFLLSGAVPKGVNGLDLDGADLYDAVLGGVGAGGFEVEEDEGAVEVHFFGWR